MNQRNIKLTVEYDGTNYSGWQIQSGRKTIQGTLTEAIGKVLNEEITLHGAGRTDAGVHAQGQVANFKTSNSLAINKFRHAINSFLPEDISVHKAEDANPDFHSQFDATSKTYQYTIVNSYTMRPIMRRYAYLVRTPMNLELMNEAAKYFVGKKDFRAFGTESGRRKSTVRTIYFLDVTKDDNIFKITINADGFLYNMVRCIAGSLVRIGRKKAPLQTAERALTERERKSAGPILPPHGLCLMQVFYD